MIVIMFIGHQNQNRSCVRSVIFYFQQISLIRDDIDVEKKNVTTI
jgi:hypothetical protein